MSGSSAAPCPNSSARISARPQTHEPGEMRQDGGLNTREGKGAERGKESLKSIQHRCSCLE